jgi:hypothetical protein
MASNAISKLPAESPATPESSAWVFGAAALTLAAFHLIGAVYLDGYVLDLRSVNFPGTRYTLFVAFWTFLGGLSTALLALALARRFGSPERFDRLVAEWNAIPERRFLIAACAAAFAMPLLLRIGVLHGAPLTDDESAYRFAAELLASGRLWVPSPPLKLFFDQNFIVNDGRMYAVYFLGWPALLVPGVWLGMPGIVNPVLSALTVPPLFRALRWFAGPSWARGGVLLFLTAPFIQIGAATELAHTACLMALTWSLWLYLRTLADDASPRDHAGFAFMFALAFCIRPQSAVPVGLPLVASWCWNVVRLDAGRRVRAIVAFLVPTTLLAALFLGSLWAQTGSPWRVGYARYGQYMLENDLQFTTFGPADLTAVPGFDFSQIGPALARTALGLFRLNSDLFGWPSSFALIVLGLPVVAGRRTRVLWAMFGSFLLLMLFQSDWGIDSFGPVHAFEVSLPILCLTIVSARNLSERVAWADGAHRPRWTWSAFAPCLLASLMITAWLGFVPIRLEGVRQIAKHVNVALRAPERAGLHRAVVFATWPFAPACGGGPGHFVIFRPVNDPDLRNDVLWVNHVSVEEDRRLLATLRDRTGYVMRWVPGCTVTLLPLADLSPGDFPPGASRIMRGLP